MMWRDLHGAAVTTLARADVADVEVRRAVSTLYYGLFHHLTLAGCEVFQDGGASLQAQAARAFAHALMRRVCERYVRSPQSPFPPPLDKLNHPTPDFRLTGVARTFVLLQEARHVADYDLQTAVVWREANELAALAGTAHDALEAVQHQPATTIFLTALLLDDRWTRRG